MTTPREARPDPAAPDRTPQPDPAAPRREAERPGEEAARRSPDPEEAPELLGERSDYPVPFGEDPGTIS